MHNLTITSTSEIRLTKKLEYLLELMTKLELDPSKPVPGQPLYDEASQSWHQPIDIYYTVNGTRQFLAFSHLYDPKIQDAILRCQKKLYPTPYPSSIGYLLDLLTQLNMYPETPIFLDRHKDETTGRWCQPIVITYWWEKEQRKLMVPNMWDNGYIQKLIERCRKQLYTKTKNTNYGFALTAKARQIYTLMTKMGFKPQTPKPQLKSYSDELDRWQQPVEIAYVEDGVDKVLYIEDIYDDEELEDILEMFNYKEALTIDRDFFE